MINNESYVLVLGASVVDITGFSNDKYRPYNSTPGCVKMSFGGVCRNIAEMSSRVGVNTKFISILGDDEKGRNIVEHSELIGYDMSDSLILKGCTTPTYMAILDEKGEMVSAIIDMWSASQMTKEFVDSKADIIENSEYTFLDSDNPEILEYILTTFSGKTRFVLDPISAAKAETIKHLIPYFHTIKPNRHEAEVMVGYEIRTTEDLIKAADDLLAMGVENVFISCDEEGIFYATEGTKGKVMALGAVVRNVTGAGDSFVAGLGYSYMNNLPIEDAVQFSIGMSLLTISHEKTIHPELDYDRVIKMIDEVKWIKCKY